MDIAREYNACAPGGRVARGRGGGLARAGDHVKAPIEGGHVGMLAAQGDVQSAQVALSVAHVLDARAEGDLGRAAHPDLTHLGLIDESV